MSTLFDACLGVIEKIDVPYRGTSGSGTTTTLVGASDSNPNGLFNLGTLFIQTGNNAGQFTKINSFVNGTYSFAAMAQAITAGQYYTSTKYSQEVLIAAVNTALKQVGPILLEDTSLTVVANQTDYTLPTGVSNIRKVEDMISGIPVTKRRWDEINGKLRFVYGFTASGSNLRLTYRGNHAALTFYSNTINGAVNINWLISKAALILLQQLETQSQDKNKWEPLIQREMATEQELRDPARDITVVKFSRW